MKRREALTVGQIIEEAISTTGHTDEWRRQQAVFLWGEVVGPAINRNTVRRFVDRDVMHVYIASGPLKSELAFVADSIAARINGIIGRDVISRIVIH